MTIGFDASRAFSNKPTGTENYSRSLLEALARIDAVNQYRVYVRGNPLVNSQLPTNFSLVVVNWPRLWTQGGLAWECLKNPPDLLFIPAHTLPFLRKNSLKTVVTIHDIGAEFLPQYHTYPSKLYLNASTVYAVKHATRIIAVSKATKNDLVLKLGADATKIRVVYEGVDHERFKVVKVAKAYSQNLLAKYQLAKNFILFVGTVQPRKNLERLIEAFSLVVRKIESDHNQVKSKDKKRASFLKDGPFQLVIVGKKGWLADPIYQAPAKFGVKNLVRFLDYVDDPDLPLFYNLAKVFVLPSLLEGFGLPVLEAAACGCPVVVANQSSLPEIMGNAAFKVDPYNPKQMAEAIWQVLTDDELRLKMVNLGLKRAAQFSWDKTAKETLKVFEEVFKRG